MSSNPRGTKRQKEAARADKRREKDARRAQRRAEKTSGAQEQPTPGTEPVAPPQPPPVG